MRKAFEQNNLEWRSARTALAALSLTFALAVFGCTTNKMPGNGQPTTDVPNSNGTPATSAVPGTSTGTAPAGHLVANGPAGMTSASIDAVTTLAADQAYGGKVLGTADPGPNPYAGTQLAPTGQFIPPSLTANPEPTVNSSISSPPIPVITSGADLTGATGLFFATASAAAPGVVGAPGTGAGVTSPMTSAAITNGTATTANAVVNAGVAAGANGATLAATNVGTTNGPGVNPSVTIAPVAVAPQTAFSTAAAPVFSTPVTVANPTNTANVLVPGQFAAGAGGGTALLGGNANDVTPTIANPGPLPVANGTFLGNANTGTLTPTISSALTPNPTVSANPPVVAGNGAVFPAGPRAAATVAASGTSTPQAVGSITIGGGNAARAAGAISISNRNAASAAANLGSLNMTSSAPATVQPQATAGRVRAASRGTGSATAAATLSAARGRAVRLVTAPNGSVVVTNTSTKDNQTFFRRFSGVVNAAPQQ